MNIKRDLSDLPTMEPADYENKAGYRPVEKAIVGPRLAEAWFKARKHDDNLPTAIPEAGPFRGSWAGKCSRDIWYQLMGAPKSNPPTIADHWRMDLGSMVHEGLQDAILVALPGAVAEEAVDMNAAGGHGSMRLDLMVPIEDEPDAVETCEIKTINGFGYKMSATDYPREGPQGPRESHVLQACLGAVSLAANGVNVKGARLVYLSMELVSPNLATNIGLGGEESRFTAEWFFPLEQCEEIVRPELGRWAAIEQAIADNEPVGPAIPTRVIDSYDVLMVNNPKTKAGVYANGQGGKTWACDYCSYQDQCIKDHGK